MLTEKMGDNLGSPSSKRQMLSEEQNIDIISNLPEEVLHHIITFLSTKEAIGTSILSTRWQNFWTSISTIKLDDGDCRCIKDIHQHTIIGTTKMIGVDKVLSRHDTSDIKKLELNFSVPVNFFRLNSRVRAAMKHNVQELNLYLTTKSKFRLPKCLYRCCSLVTLNLRIPSVLKAPTMTTLPNLKKLHLSLTIFSDEVSLQEFFSGCPVLDDLSFQDCEWKHVKCVTISLPTIRTLSIQHTPQWGDMYTEQIVISAANLRSFDFLNDLYLNFKVCDLSSLNNASIDFRDIIQPLNKFADRITNIITEIYNVKTLSITDDTLGCINIVTRIEGLPTLYNLTHLELSTGFTAYAASILMKFLEKTPKLEELNFYEGHAEDTYTEQLHLTAENVPSCFSSSLKMFSFSSFVGKSADMELLSFVLKYAILIESVTIYCNFDFPEDKVEEADKKVKTLPRSSEKCVVELIDC